MAKPAPRKHSLLVIEDRTIMAMARNSKFTKHFPFLKGALKSAKKPASCSRCGGSKVVKKNIRNLSSIKIAIAGMSREKKSLLKALLNTKHARVIVTKGNKAQKLTF